MLHPPLAGPKSKEGSCWAAHTQAASKAKPPQDTTQADSPGPEGIPYPSSFHGTSAQARVFTLAHKMALTEKLCSLFFPLSLPLSVTRLTTGPRQIQRRTATYWKHIIISSQSWISLLTCPQGTQPAGSCWLHPRGGAWGIQLFFSNKSLRFSALDNFPHHLEFFSISWKNRKTWEKLEVQKKNPMLLFTQANSSSH